MALPDITQISPNKTPGWPTGEPHIIIVHGTRGGAPYSTEFHASLNWFAIPASQVSAHWVIARDGQTARVVPDSHRAWHAAEHNDVAVGIELEQPNASDQITLPQYEKLFLIGRTYYPSIPFWHLTSIGAQAGWIEHRETPQGRRVGKTDVGTFDWQVFLNMEGDMDARQEAWLSGRLDGIVRLIQEQGGERKTQYETLLNAINTQGAERKGQYEVLLDKLDALLVPVSGPQTVKFPGATIKVPPVDMPVE